MSLDIRIWLGLSRGRRGLWGGSGLLVTARESFAMYVSRTDRFVLVRLRAGRSLLLTSAEPERFVAALQSAAPRDAVAANGGRFGVTEFVFGTVRHGSEPAELARLMAWQVSCAQIATWGPFRQSGG